MGGEFHFSREPLALATILTTGGGKVPDNGIVVISTF